LKQVDIIIIGAGPAGLNAAINAATSGADVLLIERNKCLGGQLNKQTHMFFGSEKQYASTRGIDIVNILLEKLEQFENKIDILYDATVLGIYDDRVVTVKHGDKYLTYKPTGIIVATGASEKVLAFPNNDLPGIYGAGAVQTLMNVYGVMPGQEVLMVGAGNIGLIVSYQLLQAGVKVKAVIDAAPKIGGYLVHASKLTRMGVPIYTRHTAKQATGDSSLEKVVIVELDESWQEIEGSDKTFNVDCLCISVGLTPLIELLGQVGCDMRYIPELGGLVPIRDDKYQTSIEGVFVCGDAAGVEEASSAMVEGSIAGLACAAYCGYKHPQYNELLSDYNNQLLSLREGPVGMKIRKGIEKVVSEVQYA
jgi:sarcosine oxidase subunit alpha